jgi:hypothetical protein
MSPKNIAIVTFAICAALQTRLACVVSGLKYAQSNTTQFAVVTEKLIQMNVWQIHKA